VPVAVKHVLSEWTYIAIYLVIALAFNALEYMSTMFSFFVSNLEEFILKLVLQHHAISLWYSIL